MGRYNWHTTFDSSNETMTHQFGPRMQVITSFKEMTVATLKDGVVVDKFSFAESYTLDRYQEYLVKVAESAENLNSFTDGD